VTEEPGSSTNDYSLEFFPRAWLFSQIPKHFTDKLAVMPFFLFDGSDAIFFFRISNRLPMPLIRIGGRKLAGVSKLKDTDQESAAGWIVHFVGWP
jgi:hypothetical protein